MVRARAWIATVMALTGVGLLSVTLFVRDWIEQTFSVAPDAGSGEAELLVAGAMLAVSAVLTGWAALEWRARGRTAGSRSPPRSATVTSQPAVLIRIPVDHARGMLREVARDAAGVAAREEQVVWTSPAAELLVRLGAVDLSCEPGLATVTVAVACDQVPGEVLVHVPFGVGRPGELTGLVMSTLDWPAGPAVVVDAWAPSLTAYAWDCLLRVAVRASARAGVDEVGQPLVPASVGAEDGALLVLPMARTPTALIPSTRAERHTAGTSVVVPPAGRAQR